MGTDLFPLVLTPVDLHKCIRVARRLFAHAIVREDRWIVVLIRDAQMPALAQATGLKPRLERLTYCGNAPRSLCSACLRPVQNLPLALLQPYLPVLSMVSPSVLHSAIVGVTAQPHTTVKKSEA